MWYWQINVVDTMGGKGGKFLFKPDHKGKYASEEREAVRLGIIGGVQDMVQGLMDITPVASGTLRSSWRISVDGNDLGYPAPRTMHGRGKSSRGTTYRVSGAHTLKRNYTLGQKIEVYIEQPEDSNYAEGLIDGSGWDTLEWSYSDETAEKTRAFAAAIEAEISAFRVTFEDVRRLR
jgi:hypothetical protein